MSSNLSDATKNYLAQFVNCNDDFFNITYANLKTAEQAEFQNKTLATFKELSDSKVDAKVDYERFIGRFTRIPHAPQGSAEWMQSETINRLLIQLWLRKLGVKDDPQDVERFVQTHYELLNSLPRKEFSQLTALLKPETTLDHLMLIVRLLHTGQSEKSLFDLNACQQMNQRLARMDLSERLDFLRRITSLLHNDDVLESRLRALEKLSERDPDQQARLMALTQTIMEGAQGPKLNLLSYLIDRQKYNNDIDKIERLSPQFKALPENSDKQNFLEFLSKIPEDRQTAIIPSLIKLFSIEYTFPRAGIESLLTGLKSDQQVKFINFAADHCSHDLYEFMNLMMLIPDDQLTPETGALIDALNKNQDERSGRIMRDTIRELPPNERAQLIKLGVQLCEQPEQRVGTLQFLSGQPQTLREGFLSLKPYLKGVDRNFDYILRILTQLPDSQRGEAMESLRILNQDFKAIADCLLIIDRIPENQRLESLKTLAAMSSDPNYKNVKFKYFWMLPPQRTLESLSYFNSHRELWNENLLPRLFGGVKDLQKETFSYLNQKLFEEAANGNSDSLLFLAGSIVNAQDDLLLSGMDVLYQNARGLSRMQSPTLNLFHLYLKSVIKIPEGKLQDALPLEGPVGRMIEQLARGMYRRDVQELTHLIETLEDDQRAKILQSVAPLVLGKQMPSALQLNLFKAIVAVPKEQRLEAVPALVNIFKELDVAGSEKILDFLNQEPKSDKAQILRLTSSLLESERPDPADIPLILSLIFGGRVPVDQRSQWIDNILQLFKVLNELNYTKEQKTSIQESLNWIPPHQKLHSVETLLANRELLVGDVLVNLLQHDENFRNDIHTSYMQELNAHLEDREVSYAYAEAIIQMQGRLLLHDEHPLYQRALEVALLSDPDSAGDKKNPYRLHENLKQAQTEEFVPVALTPFHKTFNLEFMKYESGQVSAVTEELTENLAINVDNIRRKAAERTAYTFGDLPPDINFQTLQQLFQSMEARLGDLPNDKKQATLDEIQSQYGYSLDKLKSNLLTDKPLIPTLLSLNGNSDDAVETAAVYLYTTLKAVKEEKATLEGETLISPQERLLLAFSTAIQNCETGQRDGIAAFYNLLDAKYRIGGLAAELDFKAKINGLIFQSVQKILGDVFMGDSLILKLTPEGRLKFTDEGEKLDKTISQGSHQSLYLKNRYSRQVGLQHRLSFDPYTGVLYDALIDASPQQVLQNFFEECPPDRFIGQVKVDIAQLLASEKAAAASTGQTQLEKDLIEFLAFNVPDNIKQKLQWIDNYFEVDEYERVVGLKDLGVIALMKTGGYLTEAPPEVPFSEAPPPGSTPLDT